MGGLPPNLFFACLEDNEVPAAHELETEAFPADEASPIEQFKMSQKVARDLFLGAFIPSNSSSSNNRRSIIAFICSTRSHRPTYTQECMKTHEPKGTTVCIHNVVVASSFRGHGVALALLREYITRVRSDHSGGLTECMVLMCHDTFCRLYEKVGFEYVGRSPVVLGSQPWHEMRLVLHTSTRPSPSTRINGKVNAPSAVSEACPLTRSDKLNGSISSRTGASSRLLSSFPGGLNDVMKVSKDAKTNKYDVLCPRTSCGSIILQAGAGRLMTYKLLPEFEDAVKPPEALIIAPSTANKGIACWRVRPNSKVSSNRQVFHTLERVPSYTYQDEKQDISLLNCAECHQGPLGLFFEGGHDVWLICSRVGYCA